MIGTDVKIVDETRKVTQATERAKYRNVRHAAASIRKEAIASIKPAPKGERRRARRRKGKIVARARHASSPPGSPPYTNRGQLKRAIIYAADKDTAIIGPRYSAVAASSQAHEFGGTYKGQQYPERPFMGPALEKNLDRFATSFRDSIF